MMRDETCLRRQWSLLRALSSSRCGLSLRAMSNELGVTPRTIRRDLEVFRAVGFPLHEEVGEFGRKTWRISAGRDHPPLAFTFEEAAALHLGRVLLEPLAGTFFGDASRLAFQKIRASLGPDVLAYLDQFAGIFHQAGATPGNYGTKARFLDALLVAIEDAKAIILTYRSDREAAASPREVHPYGICNNDGALYLIAHDPRQHVEKTYKVTRIEDVEVLSAKFARPEGFDLSAHMAPAFGVYRRGEPSTVKVRFAASVSRYVQETKRHPSQKLTPQPDGTLLAEYTVSGTPEIKSWLLSFGAKAVVIEPESLRAEVIRDLLSSLDSYAVAPRVSPPEITSPEGVAPCPAST